MKRNLTGYLLLILITFACQPHQETIRVKGSDTEVNLAVQLAETFYEQNNDMFMSVSGGGSGLGIASLMNETTDIANSSRSIKAKERALFEERGIALDSFIFAQDAIAFIVSDDLPLDSISSEQLAKILSGEYTNWSSITEKDLPISIYGRQSNSGTHGYIKKKLDIEFSQYAKEMNGNGQIMEGVKSDYSGIGYVGAGYVVHGGKEGIKVLPVYDATHPVAVSPLDADKIAEGKYLFQRPLFQYFKAESREKVQPFLDFEKSEKGKQIIADAGYYPVK